MLNEHNSADVVKFSKDGLVAVGLLFQIRGLAHNRDSYALEAERKMGQLLKLAKKNTGAKGIGPICYPPFTPGLLRQHAKDGCCRDRRHRPVGIFFPLSLEHACFFIRILDQ
jgi:hypothetical protein